MQRRAKNMIRIPHTLMLRKTASEEEKEIATEFLKMLLSKEFQLKMMLSPNFHLSIRNDVLKEQIRTIKSNDPISMSFFATEQDFYIDNPDYVETEIFFNELTDNACSRRAYKGYESILEEEFSDYFNGKITSNMLIDHLKSRVELYLEEQNDW